MKRTILGVLASLVLTSILWGCGDEPPPPPPPIVEFGFDVNAVDLDKNPMVKVPVMLDGKVVGYTDQEGIFRAVIKERAGESVTLHVGAVDGFRWVNTTSVTEELRLNSSGVGIPVELSVEAESRFRDYMFWVQAKCEGLEEGDCKGLPVLLNEEVVGQTDEFGYAHFTTSGVPLSEVKIKIDTPSANTVDAEYIMDPADPTYTQELGLEPHVYLIEETFRNRLDEEEAAATSKKSKKKRKKKRSTKSKKKKKKKKKKATKKKKKKKKKGEMIDLW